MLLLGLLGAAVVLAVQAWQVRAELTATRAEVDAARGALADPAAAPAAAMAAVAAARAHADAAATTTAGPLWRAAEHVPLLGRTVRAVAAESAAVQAVASGALGPLVLARGDVTGLRVRNGTVPLAPLAAAAAPLRQAARVLAVQAAALAAVPTAGVPGVVARPLAATVALLDRTAASVRLAATAAGLAPSLLGAHGPRRYLVDLQNLAEARGTGGVVGAWVEVSADHGRLRVVAHGADTALADRPGPPVALGAAYTALWGDAAGRWANTNESADFPTAAVEQAALWAEQGRPHLDGVLAVDPVVLADLLAVRGPVHLPGGGHLAADQVAPLVLSGEYTRWPTAAQAPARKAYLQAVVAACLHQVLTGSAGSPRALLAALGSDLAQRRLLLWDAHPSEQAVLATTAVAGVVDDQPGPYAGLAVDNLSGSKVDYYLTRSLAYQRGCPADGRVRTVVTVTLSDAAPRVGLPPYVGYRLDLGPAGGAGRGGDGSVKELVVIYTAMGARLLGASVDGSGVAATPATDAGRPVVVLSVVVRPAAATTVAVRLDEPASTADPRVWVAPGVHPSAVTVTAPACR